MRSRASDRNVTEFDATTTSAYQREMARKRALEYRHTEESKSKISQSLLSLHRHTTEKQKQATSLASSHPVERDDGVIFESVKKAAAEMGVTLLRSQTRFAEIKDVVDIIGSML